jgi:hypothetical protein
MAHSNETRTVVALAKHRVRGLLHRELKSFPQSRPLYLGIVFGNLPPEQVGTAMRELLINTSLIPEFWARLATRVPPELAAIFWMELSEQLIAKPQCEFTNFGIFSRSFSLGRLVVTFDSRLRLDRRTGHSESFSRDPIESALSHLCSYAMRPIQDELLLWSDFGQFSTWRIPLICARILTAALPRAVGSFLADERVIARSVEQRSSKPIGDDPWFSLLGLLASSLAYEAWTLAFAIELLSGSLINVDGIGRFQYMNLKSSFECDENLLRLIESNLSGQAMAA